MTMYLNDCQRTAFYEGIGLNTKEFDMHVIIEVSLWLHIISLFTYMKTWRSAIFTGSTEYVNFLILHLKEEHHKASNHYAQINDRHRILDSCTY